MALAGAENVTKMRAEFEDAIDKPLIGYGTGTTSVAAAQQAREREMAMFRASM